jgi:redox-regulated HSP33 family molecular chaperone
MRATISFQKECPVSRETTTHVLAGRELRRILKQDKAIEVFCARCAQLHSLDADERQKLSQLLANLE